MEILTLIIDGIEVAGAIIIAYMVIRVHHRVKVEKKINKRVFLAMHRERNIAFFGIFLLVFSFVLRVASVFMFV